MANLRLKKIIMEIVDNQLRANDPPITKATYKRLQTLKYSKQQAKEKIAAVLVEEIYDVMSDNEPYDEDRYTEKLKALK